MSVLRILDRLIRSSYARRLANYKKRTADLSATSTFDDAPQVSDTTSERSIRISNRLTSQQHQPPVYFNPSVKTCRCQARRRDRSSLISWVLQSPPTPQPDRRHFVSMSESRQEYGLLRPTCAAVETFGRLPTQKEYLSMLDYYDTRDEARYSSVYSHDANTPSAVEGFNTSSNTTPINTPTKTAKEQDSLATQHTIDAIWNESMTHEELYNCYRALPRPGVRYLSHVDRSKLLDRLAVSKSEIAILRYLSVIDDMKHSEIPLSMHQWNKSLHLAGRCFSRVTALQVESALGAWKDMEDKAGVKSDVTTFNILFDIATKGRQTVLAEMLLKEMTARKLKFDRFTYSGLITFYGLQSDGAGIRQSYRELVLASEIVDTSTLNCVIAALIEAGEFLAAMQVYERMKSKATQLGTQSKHNTREQSREMGSVLAKFAARYRDRPHVIAQLQSQQNLVPDLSTYIVLVRHHADRTGELQPIAKLLDEMHILGIPIHGRLFMEVFRGFANHGNIMYTSWTAKRLRDVWEAFNRLVKGDTPDVYISKWTVIWILRAYAKCCGRTETLQIWEELKSRWKGAGEGDLGFAASVMTRALERKDLKQHRDKNLSHYL